MQRRFVAALGVEALAVVLFVVSCGSTSSPVDGGTDASKDAYAGPKRIFVTHQQFSANLGYTIKAATGLASGDAICNAAAQNAGLGGTFKAWLSDGTTDAIDRIADVGPWYLVDGVTKVFDNRASLMATPLVTINVTETGVSLTGANGMTPWTGTDLGGRKSAQGNHCSGWTSNSASLAGLEGSTGATDSQWTAEASRTCDGASSLFCVEQ